MTKIRSQFRLEEKIVMALKLLSSKSMTETVETLIFREAMYKLDAIELEELFGEDFERLMLMYAVSPK